MPVYLTRDDIRQYNNRGFSLGMTLKAPLTGHIDLLQIRNGLIRILDYKPDAEKQQPLHQLTAYALALASRTRLPLKRFTCAWFDDRHYYEFFPRQAVYAPGERKAAGWSGSAGGFETQSSDRPDWREKARAANVAATNSAIISWQAPGRVSGPSTRRRQYFPFLPGKLYMHAGNLRLKVNLTAAPTLHPGGNGARSGRQNRGNGGGLTALHETEYSLPSRGETFIKSGSNLLLNSSLSELQS